MARNLLLRIGTSGCLLKLGSTGAGYSSDGLVDVPGM